MAIRSYKDCPSDLVLKVVQQLNALQADVAALRVALNQHTHTENLAASYTQNATTGAGPTLPALTSQQVVVE